MQTDLILIRDLRSPAGSHPGEPPNEPTPANAPSVQFVTDPTSDLAESIDRFYTAQQFPANWARQLLSEGGEAVMVCVEGETAALGWRISKPFYIEEVRRTLDPGPCGDYYFGDYVAPAFRGRGLQRLLVRERLRMSYRTGRHFAIAMTRASVPASLSNYDSEGFQVACTLCKREKLGVELNRFCCTNKQSPAVHLSREGWGLPFGFSLRLRR